MKLRFGEVEQILRIVHEVPANAHTRFRAKIRNLTRVEARAGIRLPSGNAGRKANYHPADLFKIAFALELLEAGVPPEPTAISVGQYWPDLVLQLFKARQEKQQGKRASRYLVAEPRLLNTAVLRFKAESGESLAARIAEPRDSLLICRLLVINPAAMLYRVEKAAQQASLDMEAFDASLDRHQAIVLKHGARI